jgi:hypothetical protein
MPYDLPPEIALQENRLNLANQYSEAMAFFLVDLPIMSVMNDYAMKTLEELFKWKKSLEEEKF